MTELSEFYYEIARNDLRETKTRREQSLEQFKDWLKKHPFIKNIKPNDSYILAFLRARKYAMDRIFESFEKMVIAIKMHPEWFDPTTEQIETALEFCENGHAAILKRDKEGRRQIIVNSGKLDPKKYSFDDVIRFHVLGGSFLTIEAESQICAPIITYDCTGISLEQYSIFSMKTFLEMVHVVKYMPMRVNKIKVAGLPKFAHTLFDFLKGFLTDKIKKRIELIEKVELEYTADDVEDLRKYVNDTKSYYDNLRDYEIDDEYLKKCEEEHESYGSFRKLEID